MGNINYSCQFDSIYAVDLEEGESIASTWRGQIVNRYDHGSHFSLTDNGTAGATQLGRRPSQCKSMAAICFTVCGTKIKDEPDPAKAK